MKFTATIVIEFEAPDKDTAQTTAMIFAGAASVRRADAKVSAVEVDEAPPA